MSELLAKLEAELDAGWTTVTDLKLPVIPTAPQSRIDRRQREEGRRRDNRARKRQQLGIVDVDGDLRAREFRMLGRHGGHSS